MPIACRFFNKSIDEKFCSFKRGFLRCMEVEEEKPQRGREGGSNDLMSMLLAGFDLGGRRAAEGPVGQNQQS